MPVLSRAFLSLIIDNFVKYDKIIAIEYLFNGFREAEIKRESGQNPEQPPLPYQMK